MLLYQKLFTLKNMSIQAVQNSLAHFPSLENSCWSSFCSTISSIPRAVQLKFGECCSTDSKIYGLIILGRLLQTAAILGVAAIIFGAVVSGPLVFFGLIPALVSGLLGTYIALSPETVQDMVFPPPPFVPGQPVGLINTANNCWANASMQLLINSPNLLNSAQRILEIRQLSQAYTATQNRQGRVVQNANGQLLRNVLSSAGQVSADPWAFEDVSSAFEYLFQDPHSLYEFQERIGGELRTIPHLEPMLDLELGQNGGEDFNNTLLSNYFNFQDQGGAEHNLKFLTPPNDLLIKLKRYSHDPTSNQYVPIKIAHSVAVPPNIALGAAYFVDGQAANYDCDGFIVHSGQGLASGHYVAYLKRPDNTWWCCDDRRVRQITEGYAHRMMHQGYVYHFSKNSPVATAS